MITMEGIMDIMELYREGYSKSAISRELGLDWKTVDKYIRNGGRRERKSRERRSKLDGYKEYIRMRMDKLPSLSGKRIYEEIKVNGYTGKISIVRDYVRKIREDIRRVAVVRFETIPGEQAQFDFKYVGRDREGNKVYAFVGILGYSRVRYVEFVLSMKLPILFRCMKRAFEYWGGVPKEGLFDRMRCVVIDGGLWEVRFNPRFLDFAMHYGFRPRVCRAYRPQTKGKVERSIGYFSQDFLYGREELPINVLNEEVLLWCNEVNNKVHSETNEIPFERLRKENLSPLPKIDYDVSFIEHRYVSRESCISLWGNRYSVNPLAVGKVVTVKIDEFNNVRIFDKDICVGYHELCLGKNKRIINAQHQRAIWGLYHLNENKRRELNVSEEVEVRPLSVYEEVITL